MRIDVNILARMKDKTAAAYNRFLCMNQLRDTKQRRLIFQTFMEQDKHLTAEGLYHMLKKELPQIGQATVYRTLKLLCNNGFAQELNLRSQGSPGIHTQSSYFEPSRHCEHHDHLICTECGQYFEFHNEELEALQLRIATEHGFTLKSHTLVLYGQCNQCINGQCHKCKS